MKLSTQALLTSLSKAVKHVGVFILSIVLTRYFTKDDYGSYLQIMLVANTLIYLSVFGLPSSLYYFLPVLANKKAMLRMTLVLLLSIACGVSGLIFIFSEEVFTLLNNPSLSSLAWIVAGFVLFQIPIKAFEPLMVSTQKVPIFVAVNAFFNTGFLFAVLIPVMMGVDFKGILEWLFVFFILQFSVIYIVIIFTYLKLEDSQEGDQYSVSQQFRYSVPIGLSGAISELSRIVDKVIVSSYFTPAMLAVYARGAMEIPMLNVVVNSLGNILMPRFVEEYKKGNQSAVLSLWHSSIKIMAIAVYPAFVFLMTTAYILIPLLFSEKYVESVPIFQVYTITLLSRITTYDAIVRAVGQTQILLKITLFSVALNIVLTIALIELFGLVGAPIATVICVFLVRYLYLRQITHIMGTPLSKVFPWISLVRIFSCSIVSIFPVVCILIFAPLVEWVLFLISALVYAVTYLYLAKAMGVIEGSERKAIHGILPKKLRWLV